MSGLPPIPHCEIEPECCGCLCEVAADTTYFVCNECGAIVSKEEAARIVTEMESTDVTCPTAAASTTLMVSRRCSPLCVATARPESRSKAEPNQISIPTP
jgi:hypothetical protein